MPDALNFLADPIYKILGFSQIYAQYNHEMGAILWCYQELKGFLKFGRTYFIHLNLGALLFHGIKID